MLSSPNTCIFLQDRIKFIAGKLLGTLALAQSARDEK